MIGTSSGASVETAMTGKTGEDFVEAAAEAEVALYAQQQEGAMDEVTALTHHAVLEDFMESLAGRGMNVQLSLANVPEEGAGHFSELSGSENPPALMTPGATAPPSPKAAAPRWPSATTRWGVASSGAAQRSHLQPCVRRRRRAAVAAAHQGRADAVGLQLLLRRQGPAHVEGARGRQRRASTITPIPLTRSRSKLESTRIRT